VPARTRVGHSAGDCDLDIDRGAAEGKRRDVLDLVPGDQDAFVEAALADAGDDGEAYDRVAPFWQSWQGLKRYWETRS